MQALLDLLAENDDDGWIRIVDASWFDDDLKLEVIIHLDGDRPAESWEIECTGVVEELICSDGAAGLSLSAEAPCLKWFLEPEVSITFSDNDMSPEALLALVTSCCYAVMGDLDCLERGLNGAPSLDGIVRSRYGLLGRFPATLAARIGDSLKDRPIRAGMLPGRLPQRWDGIAHANYPPLQVLELGRSYVIGQQFHAQRALGVEENRCFV
ncbi:hypothetical protein KY495_18140 [Massilia sp. PAMC28688]|uniref:hypothetical protein n=1 Tax=Massilia sp. PAMC28688 TaxID=2861283 RepID=UPI001C63553E|nr:hypothetical protein [Massilia sp. PAMC28688]QYF92641.1 hypothetical protein KY495_18140 [Massilia sp. PAMC28688]